MDAHAHEDADEYEDDDALTALRVHADGGETPRTFCPDTLADLHYLPPL